MTDVRNMAVTVLQTLFGVYKILHCKRRQDLGLYSPTILKDVLSIILQNFQNFENF